MNLFMASNPIIAVVDWLEWFLWDTSPLPISLLAILLVGTGLWFTVQTGFIQFRGFKKGFRLTFGGLFSKSEKAGKHGMSSFQALATAIAAQVGTGNIVGASTAIAVGGPGAIFWMWIAAIFGMGTIFAEAVLAQKYKVVGADGHVTGGPVYYIKDAIKGPVGKFLAALFAVLIILSLGFMGNAVQSNGIASAWKTAFGIDEWIMGLILAGFAFLIFVGGISRIASFTEKVVPAMACVFIIGALVVIIAQIQYVPEMILSIFEGAFAPKAVLGGAVGSTIAVAMSKGIARGLFSNEAGMGSTPHAHAVAKVAHPGEQGFVAMMGVFIDTFIILNLTAFVDILYLIKLERAGEIATAGIGDKITGAALAQAGFSSIMGPFGNVFIAICLLFFAFSTIIGWYFFGEANFKYLFNGKGKMIYNILVCVCVFLGGYVLYAGIGVNDVWNAQDMLNGLMVIPNLIGILLLTGVVKATLKDNINQFGLK